jgi:hypothetical protein
MIDINIMDSLIAEFTALNNEELRNIRIDIEEIVDLVGTGDKFPFALSNIWDTEMTQKGLDYAKKFGYEYAITLCINKGYYTIYQDVLKTYIDYYISILEDEVCV